MKAILTNDDGVHAQGLDSLRRALAQSMDVIVVAPDTQKSECGHSVTSNRPLQLTRHDSATFSVDGTPVDCVRIGMAEIAKDASLIVSGINHGANLGTDIWMSGTVAAAREGSLRGKLAIAVSQYQKQELAVDWNRAANLALQCIEMLTKSSKAGGLWNINLPALGSTETPQVVHCDVDDAPLPIQFQTNSEGLKLVGSYHDRPRTRGKDVATCFAGCITISKL